MSYPKIFIINERALKYVNKYIWKYISNDFHIVTILEFNLVYKNYNNFIKYAFEKKCFLLFCRKYKEFMG